MNDGTRHIIERVLRGDRRAFRTLIRRHQRLVGHIVFRMVSDPRDREELAQDVFIKAHRNLKQFRFDAKFATWLAKIAYNACLNHLEKKQLLLCKRVRHHVPRSPTRVVTPVQSIVTYRPDAPHNDLE